MNDSTQRAETLNWVPRDRFRMMGGNPDRQFVIRQDGTAYTWSYLLFSSRATEGQHG